MPKHAPEFTFSPGARSRGQLREVDLHQGGRGPAEGMVEAAKTRIGLSQPFMPPLSRFKKFDVRPLLEKGREPLPEILKRILALKPEEGLIVVAPFLPSPLIERLGSEGFEFKVEPAQGGPWIVYFWRENRFEATI